MGVLLFCYRPLSLRRQAHLHGSREFIKSAPTHITDSKCVFEKEAWFYLEGRAQTTVKASSATDTFKVNACDSGVPSPSHTTSHVAQASWRPAEDMDNHDQGRPGTALWTANLRPRTMEKGLGESV